MALTKDQKKIKELELKLSDLQKCVEQASSSERYYSERYSKIKDEIENIHAMLDEFPNAPARKRKTNGYTTIELSVQSRLTSWFASLAVPRDFPTQKLKEENEE